MRFAPEYVTYVLNENFEDAKELFLTPLIALHYAHLVMLAERGIVSATDAHTLRQALDTISQDAGRRVQYDGTYEGLFFYVDRLGAGVAGEGGGVELRGAFLDVVERHRDTVLALHTHTQRAQPSTVAHYLLAVVEQLER